MIECRAAEDGTSRRTAWAIAANGATRHAMPSRIRRRLGCKRNRSRLLSALEIGITHAFEPKFARFCGCALQHVYAEDSTPKAALADLSQSVARIHAAPSKYAKRKPLDTSKSCAERLLARHLHMTSMQQRRHGRSRGRHCLLHGVDELLERKGLRQERELAVGRQVFLEGVLGIA